MAKTVSRKFFVGLKVFRERGLLGFLIVCLEFLQKHLSKKQNNDERSPIYSRVKYIDAIKADLDTSRKKWKGTNAQTLRFNWLMPPPGKGSGGHLNIFRFIKYLEESGHQCRIYLYSINDKSPISAIRATMGDSYPKLNASMEWLPEDGRMKPAEGVFATSWETAYPIYNSKLNARRFYFVQDFEPYFYPAGSMYTLAENTYKMGFYGITAGGWLAEKLRRDYKMQADHFDFGSNPATYSFTNNNKRKEIFFYARPYTERRGFELGTMALDLFHRQHPEFIINLAGYDLSTYSIPFPYNNLKILEIRELSDLYNRCAAGLVLSFTNMSLLPLELLSCGTIPVVNDGENNRLVSDNKFICYSNSDPSSLAKSLSAVVSRSDLREHAKSASMSTQLAGWDASGRKFVSIVEREIKKHE